MKKNQGLGALAFYLFELFFVLVPVLYIFILSFTKRTDSWEVIYEFTLENYREILNPIYFPALKQSLKVASVSTLTCILLGYPAGLAIARQNSRWKTFFIKANMIPFLFNSMMRICGLIIILRKNGLLELLLRKFGVEGDLQLLYSFPATIIGMVYVLLPLMIYSVFSSVSKMNYENLEAASVLGANRFRAFLDITLPLSAGGLLNGIILCFIPAMGLYIITSLLGGGTIVIVSNVIESQIMKVRNLPFGAALSVCLMALTGLFIALARLLDPVAMKRRKAQKKAGGKN